MLLTSACHSVNKARADRKENEVFIHEASSVLGDGHVHRCLGNSVPRLHTEVGCNGEIKVADTRRQRDDLCGCLGCSGLEKLKESVDTMNEA